MRHFSSGKTGSNHALLMAFVCLRVCVLFQVAGSSRASRMGCLMPPPPPPSAACGCCRGNRSLPVEPEGCESLSVSCHGGRLSHALKISHEDCVCLSVQVCVCVCVWLTTNGVVVWHQVLSPGWGSNTCQLKFGGSVWRVFIMAGNCRRRKYMRSCFYRPDLKRRPGSSIVLYALL